MPRVPRTIAGQLWLVFGGIVAAGALIGASAVLALDAIGDASRQVREVEGTQSAAAYEMEIDAIGTGLGVLTYVVRPDPRFRARVAEDSARFEASLATYARLAETPKERRLARRIETLHDAFLTTGERMMALRDPNAALTKALARGSDTIGELVDDPPVRQQGIAGLETEATRLTAPSELDRATRRLIQLRLLLDESLDERIQTAARADAESAARHAARTVRDSRAIVLGLIAIAVAIALGGPAVALLTRRIARRLGEIVEGVRFVGIGRFDHRIAPGGPDEISMLAASFNDMAEQLRVSRARLEGAYTDLELVVEARTAELGETNQKLREELANREQARELLLRLQRRQELILTSAGQGIVGVSPDGLITFANPAAAATIGRSESEFLGRPLHDAVHGSGGHEPGDCPLVTSVRRGAPMSGHDVFRRPDGTELSVEYTSTPIQDGTDIAGGVLVFEDVTERLELERRVQLSQRLDTVGLLAGGIAHDVNNVLMAISGSSEILLQQLTDDKLRSEVEEILKATARASSVTSKVLAFSRQQTLRPKPVSLTEIVTGMEPMLQRVLPANVALETALDEHLELVKVDAAHLEQVVLNLVVNSRDAMSEGGTITIATRVTEVEPALGHGNVLVKPGRYAVLQVSDTGVGMDAETQAKVFEPFFSTKPAGEGTGLGLSTAYGIVKQSGGYILASSAPGAGATFEVYFPPTRERALDTPGEPAPPPTRDSSGTVLVVDDDPGVRSVLVRLLTRLKYTTLEACDEEEALRVADAAGEIDVLVTDMSMPGPGGEALAHDLVGQFPALKVVFVSGFVGATPPALVREGRAALLQKPFVGSSLQSAIERLVEREQAPQASRSSTAVAS